MSWFDASGLANIAKTALKEAQKTIDKALDIRDEDDITKDDKAKSTSSSGSAFPLGSKEKQGAIPEVSNEIVNEKDVLSVTMPTWGSFTGSFFQVDNYSSAKDKASTLISTQPQKLSLILSPENQNVAPSTTSVNELTHAAAKSKSAENVRRVVDGIESSTTNLPVNVEHKKYSEKDDEEKDNLAVHGDSQNKPGETSEEKITTRARGRGNSSNRNSYVSNRLSILSTDSEGKRSSDSVEVLGSPSCTTSPDTDLPSASSSLGLPVSPSCTDSVEVIDSLASPSSIEVLVEGTLSGRTTQSPFINSPKDEKSVNQNLKTLKTVSSPLNSVNDVSPESFEVIPDLPEYDDELSIGDSYNSASESTGPTILEPSYQYSYRTTESYNDISQASSKFRSGDSTPDISSKFQSMSRSSGDVLTESTPKVVSFESNQSKSAEIKRTFNDGDKLNETCNTLDEVSDTPGDLQQSKTRSSQGSPNKKLLLKSEDRGLWLKSEDVKYQKPDLSKSDLPKTHTPRKDIEEVEPPVQEERPSDAFNTEEISGSVSSFSDTRTIVANDSSLDEIVLDISSEDVGSIHGSEETTSLRTAGKLEGDAGHHHSYYVKNLLSEAMREMSATRETSPTLSEKSRSDLVKVGSEQTSGHTSGDELETTTSSDIEIISRYSPNGDSSSTASRHSPAKLLHHNSKSKLSLVAVDILGKVTQTKTKGHQREPSEASSFCSEDNFPEVEKLSKRVAELTEILEARESRLNDLRKSNLELQEKNQELKREMEQVKKFANNNGQNATESEKDELIRELKEEGEKLSKKELKQATLIKTLRAHEKSQQSIIDGNNAQIQNLTKAVEDLKTELSSKKESEKVLSESVKQMNKKITRQDEEIAKLLNQTEKAVVQTEQLKILLDAKEAELAKFKELLAAEDFELQDAKSIADSKTKQLERLKAFQENAEIKLEDLSQQLKKAEEMHSEREKQNKTEKSELMRRLQEAEGRNEELAQSVSKATRPLLRQMEALQATTAHERDTWEKQERNLLQKLEEAESQLSSLAYNEKSFKQETMVLRSKVSNLEDQLKASNQEVGSWKIQVSSLSNKLDEMKLQSESERTDWEKQQEALKVQVTNLKAELTTLEVQVAQERANVEAERRRTTCLQDQLKERDGQPIVRDSNSSRSSPTLSFGRVSLSESLSSNVWPQFGEDGFETSSVSGRCSNVYENLRAGNTTSLLENLQAQLKMRDGEISQLQWELQRRDAERSALTTELSSLTSKIEEQEGSLANADTTDKNLKELQTKYDALLEMYGEKVEEVDELRLDLQDVKEMYKSQIDQLLKKEKQDAAL